ncbi:hypothetical protein C7E17_20740 [Stenotrophomonas maltophilia]|nr:hypothetical protein C7E17_20740 [Stenotrophomonas maltophilia]
MEPGYDVIISEPAVPHAVARRSPGHRPALHRRGRAGVAPGGRLYVVANRHLPYEYTLNESFGAVRVIAERDGFKLVEAVKGKGK